jgi:integrating conjugative element protein (TIGR03758 family)
MNSDMRAGFLAGSGVDPSAMKLVIVSLGAGAVLLVVAWIVLQLIVAHNEERLTPAQALMGVVKTVVVVCVLIAFIALL